MGRVGQQCHQGAPSLRQLGAFLWDDSTVHDFSFNRHVRHGNIMPANQSEASADALSEGNIDAPNRESVNTLLWPEQGKAAVDWGAWPGNQSRRGRADPECAQGTDSASDARKDKERGRPITLHIRLAGGAGFGRVAMDDAARQYFLKTLAHGCQRVRSEAPSARIAKRLQGHHLSYPTLGNALESSWYPGIAELVGTYPGRPWCQGFLFSPGAGWRLCSYGHLPRPIELLPVCPRFRSPLA